MKDNWKFYVQIALKSGQFSYGSQLIPSIQNKKAHLVLISEDCGRNRKKKLIDKCTFYDIPYRQVPDVELQSLSHIRFNSVAVLDKGLAQAILNEGKEW